MSKFRASIAWLVLFTQVWTPALAQTLPIQVDNTVAGQRPVVGMSNGVPVINIAPPSAGGVSNNRYLQFNVGPSGVVLNNSGAASQTQTAGRVAGNPMLGNQRAATILNQVTADNPSRLQGMLEVAGNRANVIVANPAGITCNGCGFLNANRATLTTGKPIIGPDGSLHFDVTRGHIGIEGLGLNASNVSRMELLSRALQINAGIWADQLDVVAGAGRIDYGTGAISAGVGEGSAPALALDTAALGGMYANSIRLVGTEAGVGVNVGGNLTAMSGSLELSVNGELRVRPDARLQAAQDLKARSTTLVNDGTIIASRDLSLVANGSLSSAGAIAAGGELTLSASGALRNTGGISSVGNVIANAGAFSNAGAITAGQRADGSLGSGGLRITSASVQNTGTLVAGGNAQVIADAITLDRGKIVSGEALSLQAVNTLSNRGGAAHGRTADIEASLVDNQGGALTANATLGVRTAALDNRLGTVAATTTLTVQADAIDNRAGTLAADGALTLAGSTLDNRDKGVIAGDTVALAQTRSIDNRGGVVQARGAVNANPAGTLNNAKGEIYGKNIGLTAASLDNTGGRIVAIGTLAATARGVLDNSRGTLAATARGVLDNSRGTMATQGQAAIGAQSLINAGGLIAAQGITLANLGVLDNTSGLLQADGKLGITAGSVLNRDTAAVGGASLGMIAKQLQIDTTSLDNQRGRIGASETLTLSTGQLDNTGGAIGSDGSANLSFSTLTNASGTVSAGSSLTLTTGALDNTGRIQSGADLTINAASLNNRAAGEIVAAGNNVLNVAGTLANAGLIDGGFTRIDAGEVVNTGRIYGDRIAIKTPTLKNEPNAVVASRADLDLGVNTLINREHALIFAGGDMRIGGTLDASHKSTGQAALVSNDSATIEVAGNAHIAAARLQNRNLHVSSETVETGRQSKWYYRLNASDEIHDGTGMWFCNIVKSICGQTPSFLGGFHERRLLMPSERYPEARYGPPFDYSSIQGDDKGRRGESAPIGLAYTEAYLDAGGGDAGMPVLWPAKFMYPPNAKIWEVFGIERPSGVREPVGLADCVRNCEALRAQKAAYDRDITLYEALNAEIRAFNSDFLNNRMVKDFFYYEVVEIKRETRITSSDPGKILVGGDARLVGNVVNDKSQIVAGGTLIVTGGQLDNIGAAGERVTRLVGEAVWTYDSGGRKHSRSPYDAVVAAE
ncbi:filamentous hemagglutinin N-terminal domain-containing protein, partial [Pseudomonadota bacterium AL_CKDN230030165-1A_HGKHYDSX7]